MSDLSDLDKRIAEKLATQREQAYQHYNHQAELRHQWQHKHACYTALADHLVKDIIRPRLQKLADHFDNAHLLDSDQLGRHQSVCEFERTPWYPAKAKLELSVSRDGLADFVMLLYDLSILPVFFRFAGHDEMTLPLDQVDEEKVSAWFDEKIICFLDAYLNLETLDQYQTENEVIDPVCGIRLNRLYAAVQRDYQGRTYYFCVPECRAMFDTNAGQYLGVRGSC